MTQLRSIQQRKADVIAALESQRDLWLATADGDGRPQLIAVSAWWSGGQVTIATTATSRSARNLALVGLARLALGTPEDVIVIDAELDASVPVGEAEVESATGFASAVGWDPRTINGDWAYFRLRPTRIQAYRGYDELEGREVMRDGRWLV
jgi:hypothetical protein